MTGGGVRRSGGQALVEFALVVSVFLLIVFGVVDGARLVFSQNTVGQVAREAARLAAVQAPFVGRSGSACTAPTCPATTAVLRTNVLAAANRMAVTVGPIASANLYLDCTAPGSPRSGAWTGGNDCSANRAAGASNVVNVRVVASFRPATPIVGQLIDALYPAAERLSASSSMVIP